MVNRSFPLTLQVIRQLQKVTYMVHISRFVFHLPSLLRARVHLSLLYTFPCCRFFIRHTQWPCCGYGWLHRHRERVKVAGKRQKYGREKKNKTLTGKRQKSTGKKQKHDREKTKVEGKRQKYGREKTKLWQGKDKSRQGKDKIRQGNGNTAG